MQGPARTVLIIFMLLAALLGGAWYSVVGTPEYSLYRLSQAIQARDPNAAERYLDIESMAKEMAEASVEYFRSNQGAVAPSSEPWGQLGQAFAQGLIELMLPALKSKIEEGVKGELRNAITKGQTETKLLTLPTNVRELRSSVRVVRSGSSATATMFEGSKVLSIFRMAQQSDRHWRIVALDRQWFLSYLRESSLEEQRKIAAEAKAREEEQKRLAEEARKKEEALLAELRKVITVAVFEKGFEAHDFERGIIEDSIMFKISMRNGGSKAIRAFRGTIVFKDLFDAEISSIGLSYDKGLSPGQVRSGNYSIHYNQFKPEDRKLRDTALANMQVEWKPKTILFSDGSKLGE